MNQLRQGVAISTLSPMALDKLRQLVNLQEDVLIRIAQELVLKNLRYDEMHGRFDMVDEQHSDTFQWILNDRYCFHTDDLYGSQEPKGLSKLGINTNVSLNDNSPTDTGIVGNELLPVTFHCIETTRVTNAFEGEKNNDIHPTGVYQAECNGSEDNSDKSELYVDYMTAQGYGAKKRAREALMHWLSAGEGIFHISGKLGSGKSTFMKFLCTHDTTRAKLHKWAGRLLNRKNAILLLTQPLKR
jgi:hypothetical protein